MTHDPLAVTSAVLVAAHLGLTVSDALAPLVQQLTAIGSLTDDEGDG